MRKIIELYGRAGSGKTYIVNKLKFDKRKTSIFNRRNKIKNLFMYLYFIVTNINYYRSLKKSIRRIECINKKQMHVVFRSYIITLSFILLNKDKNVILDEGIVQRWMSISRRSRKYITYVDNDFDHFLKKNNLVWCPIYLDFPDGVTFSQRVKRDKISKTDYKNLMQDLLLGKKRMDHYYEYLDRNFRTTNSEETIELIQKMIID